MSLLAFFSLWQGELAAVAVLLVALRKCFGPRKGSGGVRNESDQEV